MEYSRIFSASAERSPNAPENPTKSLIKQFFGFPDVSVVPFPPEARLSIARGCEQVLSGDREKLSRWCSGLAYEPVTLMTRVRIPTGTPLEHATKTTEVILPSSALFSEKLAKEGPVAQHGRASGFYFQGGEIAPGGRNQVVVGPNPTRPTRLTARDSAPFSFRLIQIPPRASEGRSNFQEGNRFLSAGQNSFSLHFGGRHLPEFLGKRIAKEL